MPGKSAMRVFPSSWPGEATKLCFAPMSRPSTSFLGNKTRTWITGTSPVMTTSRCPDHPLSVMAGRRDEAIHLRSCDAEPWIASLSLAKTMMEHSDLRRLCEERSDEAIHLRSCDAEPWIASLRPQRRHENPQITPPPASAALWPTRGSDKKDRARCNDDVTTKSFGCLKSKIR